eukprot:GILI01003292.1.p1 GENE.GILI01003292.1~~GILI01003292.1.p1  ORF type:complete len:194 (-),score=28.42 GILI01003292.1:81-578(-)
MEGDVIFGSLDYLFKELRRQQAMAKVNALRSHAEAERKLREEEQTQKRLEEDANAALAEVQYAALVRSVDNSVDSYLTQLFSRAIERTAEVQALREEWAHLRAQPAPRNPTEAMEQERLVTDLLKSYIVPEACRNVEEDSKASALALSGAALDAAKELVNGLDAK